MTGWKKLFDDVVEQVGQGLETAGTHLRGAADEAMKVAGVGVGTIEFHRLQSSYAMGDSICGSIELRLPEPIAARRLVVALRATRKRTRLGTDASGRRGPVRTVDTVFEHEVELAGERSFASGEHYFAVHIPSEIDASVTVDGALGDVLRAAQSLRSMTESATRWCLHAYLDIAWKRNLSKEIDLFVTGGR